jgi:hypothetical protein
MAMDFGEELVMHEIESEINVGGLSRQDLTVDTGQQQQTNPIATTIDKEGPIERQNHNQSRPPVQT